MPEICSLLFKSGIEIHKEKDMFYECETYLRINKNIKRGVSVINFSSEFKSVYFDRFCQNRAFNI